MCFRKVFILFIFSLAQNFFTYGCCCSCCEWCPFFGKKDVRILMVGLDAAGKTTILYQLKMGETVKTKPTLGFNVETIEYKKVLFIIWDVGGKEEIKVSWKQYYQNTDGLIFVVDSNDQDRIEDAAEELKKMLAEEELKDCPVLVYANKQDINNVLCPREVYERLKMGEIKERSWLVQGTSATTGQGLKEGLDWMAGCLTQKKKKKLMNN